jgi:hypothetical protein
MIREVFELDADDYVAVLTRGVRDLTAEIEAEVESRPDSRLAAFLDRVQILVLRLVISGTLVLLGGLMTMSGSSRPAGVAVLVAGVMLLVGWSWLGRRCRRLWSTIDARGQAWLERVNGTAIRDGIASGELVVPLGGVTATLDDARLEVRGENTTRILVTERLHRWTADERHVAFAEGPDVRSPGDLVLLPRDGPIATALDAPLITPLAIVERARARASENDPDPGAPAPR